MRVLFGYSIFIDLAILVSVILYVSHTKGTFWMRVGMILIAYVVIGVFCYLIILAIKLIS